MKTRILFFFLWVELAKLNRCKDFLRQNGVFDKDSFMDLNMED